MVVESESEASEEPESDGSDHVPMKKRKVGRPSKSFSESGKKSQQMKLDEVYQLCIEMAQKHDISFNEILGTVGSRWYHGDGNNSDFAHMYEKISENQNPFSAKVISPEKALFVKETCFIGRATYETIRNTFTEADLPSRHAIEKVRNTLLLLIRTRVLGLNKWMVYYHV